MPIERTADGKLAVRVQIRTGADGYTMAAMETGNGQWMVLATIPAPPYHSSPEVRRLMVELAQAIAAQAIKDALDGAEDESTLLVAPGAPLDAKAH